MRPPASAQTVHVGLEAITGDAVRLAGGRWRAVLRVEGLQLWLRDAGDQEAVLVAFAAFLNGLAFPVQLLVRVLPFDGDPYLERLERAGRGGPESLAAVARDHAAFFRRLAREGAFLERRFYLVVPAPAAVPGWAGGAPRRRGWGRPSGWPSCWPPGWPFGRPFGRRGDPDGPPAATAADESGGLAAPRLLAARCAEVERGLGRCGLTAWRLSGGELVELFYACWCPDLARVQRLPTGPAAHEALVVGGSGGLRPGPGPLDRRAEEEAP